MASNVESLQRALLSAEEVRNLTGWPDLMVEDYISILQDLFLLAENLDGSEINIDAHINDTTIHYPQSAINHNDIQNNGTYTHADIDAHLNGTATKHDADDIDYDNVNTQITAGNVQAALDQIHAIARHKEAGHNWLYYGGRVTSISGTQVSVDPGRGLFINSWGTASDPTTTEVTWVGDPTYTLTMPDPIGIVTVYMDNTGTVGQKNGCLTTVERRDYLELAKVAYQAGAILGVEEAPSYANSIAHMVLDYLNFKTLGEKISGLKVRPVTSALSVYHDAGEIFLPWINRYTSDQNPHIQSWAAAGNSTTPEAFDVLYADGSVYLSAQTVLPKVYESAPGVATALPTGQATIHYVQRLINEKPVIILGQNLYGSGKAARDALDTDLDGFQSVVCSNGGFLRAQIYLSETATDFSDDTLAAIVNTGSVGASSAGFVAAQTFLALTDVLETTYTGQAGKSPIVNATETGLEFQTVGNLNIDGGRADSVYTAGQVVNGGGA